MGIQLALSNKLLLIVSDIQWYDITDFAGVNPKRREKAIKLPFFKRRSVLINTCIVVCKDSSGYSNAFS